MNIIHVLNHTMRNNGHVHMAIDLATAQADLGHNVAVVHNGGSFDDLIRQCGVVSLPLNFERSSKGVIRSAKALFHHARDFGADILHAHMMSSTMLALPTALIRPTRLLATMHNSFDSHSWLMSMSDHVACVSESEFELLKHRGYDAARMTVIPNGPLGSRRGGEQDETPSLLPNGSLVATLSGLHPRKAVGDAIRAFDYALAEPLSRPWHLLVIGDGPELQNLRDLAGSLKASENIHFMGAVVNPKLILDEVSIFVTAAVAEPFGLNVAEARGSRCAVVATGVGGIVDVLENGRAGILVNPGKIREMGDKLRGLMTDPSELQKWQDRAAVPRGQFSTTKMATSYVELYKSLPITSRRRRVTKSLLRLPRVAMATRAKPLIESVHP